MRERGERDRQTDRQTDRDTDRQTERGGRGHPIIIGFSRLCCEDRELGMMVDIPYSGFGQHECNR